MRLVRKVIIKNLFYVLSINLVWAGGDIPTAVYSTPLPTSKTQMKMHLVSQAVALYYSDCRIIPKKMKNFKKIVLNKKDDCMIPEKEKYGLSQDSFIDQFGKELVLELKKKNGFTIISFGPDGVYGTRDDLKYEREFAPGYRQKRKKLKEELEEYDRKLKEEFEKNSK